jgi:hypothetical protein
VTAYVLSADTNIDELAAKAGGDTYDVNGYILTIDQDSRVGLNQSISASLGAITINATKGGKCNIDGTKIRLIPYNSGTGNVPAWNTVVSQGSASGKLIGVYSALTAASTASGAAMPASGYIKIKQWNSIAFTAGALTGIGASATGADTVGWLDLVGDQSATVNANRLGEVNITGAWYSLGSTSGSPNQTVQIPNSGQLRYAAGVFIEKTVGLGDYEFYPNAGTAITIGTEADRGKVVWIDDTGLVRIGNNGSGTMGYTPAAGLAIVVPNIFLENCTTGARTVNVIPNATIATRYDFTCTGGGVVNIDKCNSAWYLSFAQAYSVTLTNTCTIDGLLLQECASAIAWSKVGVGNKPTTALTMSPLTMTLCFAGGTMTDCVWARVAMAGSGAHILTITDVDGFTFTRNVIRGNTIRGNSTTYALIGTRMVDCTFTDCVVIQGALNFATCSNISVTGLSFMACVSGTTVTTYTDYVWLMTSKSVDCTLSGLTLPVTGTQPYTALMSLGVAGCSNIKLRNIGTRASPLSLSSGGNFTGLIYELQASAAATDIYIQRVYCSGTRTNIMTADNSSKRVTEENVFGDYADAPLAAVLNFKRKGCGGVPAVTAQTSIYGTHFGDCFTSTTEGRVYLMMNEANSLTASLITLSGGAAFTSAGGLYMPAIGQIAVFETPDYIIGHTSFQNTAPVMGGGTIGNYTLEFQIDKNDGNGYSGWATMNAANLSGVTGIDASLGFKMKWRITTSSTNTTAITSLRVLTNSTTTAQDYQYPLDNYTVTVTVVDKDNVAIQNAQVAVYVGSTAVMNEDSDASGVAEGIYSSTVPANAIYKVRKSSVGGTRYIPASGPAVITEDGMDIKVVLYEDNAV